MKIVFMGTPDFAVPCLQMLIEEHHQIQAVFTQPDKPKGRGYQLAPPPVKEIALQNNLPVYQPLTLKDEAIQQQIAALAPDLIVVVAYGRILPKAVLDTPKFGCVNVHGSLLPKYRGAGPIQWSVLNGEEKTGITTMYMGEGLDTGDMLLKRETPIGENETSGELFDRLCLLGAQTLKETILLIEQGKAVRTPQDEQEATYAPMLKKEMAKLDFTKTAQQVHNWVRGMNPWPTAYCMFNGKMLKIHASAKSGKQLKPGLARVEDNRLFIGCAEGAIEVLTLQMEGARRMDTAQFLCGHAGKIDGYQF